MGTGGSGRPLPGPTATRSPDPTGSAPAAARKVVTVLFCDAVGSTDLGEQYDPELLQHAMTRYFEAVASVISEGARFDFPVADGEAIIDAAIRAGRSLPYSCKGGMCCTCRARLVEGRVQMAVNYSLEPWELQAGYVLTCQSRPLTERVVIDYDQV